MPAVSIPPAPADAPLTPAPEGALRAAFAAPLSGPAIEAAAGRGATLSVAAVVETGSTNADLLARARRRAPAMPWLLATVAQTAGRGRLGRRWHATPGSALLFSVALPLASDRGLPGAVTLAAGVALAEALPVADLRLKWPNDLMLDGAKLGGVLAELAVDAAGARTLVIGVGVNLWLDAAARGSIGQPAAALSARVPLAQLASQRESLIGRCAAAVIDAADDCLQRGFVPFQPRFMQRFAHLGARVELSEHGARVLQGRALGVDGEGRLLVDAGGRVTAFRSGEVSLRVPRPAGRATEGGPVGRRAASEGGR